MYKRGYRGGTGETMIAYLVDVEFVWGFQARIVGLSKSNPSFLYPPPTTFLGALAEVIAKKYRLGEKKGVNVIPALSRNLLGIGFRPLNFIPLRYEDINRIIAVKITGGKLYPNPEALAASFDSPARGKTILTSLDSEASRMRWFLILGNESITLGGQEITLDESYFWKIRRLGSKESLVSVVNVEKIEDISTVRDNVVCTRYSFPFSSDVKTDILTYHWEKEVYVNPFNMQSYNPVKDYIEGERLMTFYVPVMRTSEPPEIRVGLKPGFKAYNLGEEGIVIGKE